LSRRSESGVVASEQAASGVLRVLAALDSRLPLATIPLLSDI
jgi:hypothetical protein